MLFPTYRVIEMKTSDGAEILIHIGTDTIKMNGDGFKTLIQQGDCVKKSRLRIEFDIAKIKAAGYPTFNTINFV